MRARNTAPTAAVTLGDAEVTPSSVLTADAEGADLDGDAVALSYRWLRNGVVIDGGSLPTLALDGLADEGDVMRVEVLPHDGKTDGHAASAEIVVAADKPLPTIVVRATSAGGTYAEGTWATDDVVVSFTCTGLGVDCPEPVTISTDTGPGGAIVERTITDQLGRQATAGIRVWLDRAPPLIDRFDGLSPRAE